MHYIDLIAQDRMLKAEIDANIQSVLDSAQFIGGSYVRELEALKIGGSGWRTRRRIRRRRGGAGR